MLAETGRHLGIAEALVVLVVEHRKGIELGSSTLAGNALGVGQVQHRISLAAQEDALVIGGHETGSPQAAEKTLLGMLGLGVHHDVVGQVLVHAAQAVTQP